MQEPSPKENLGETGDPVFLFRNRGWFLKGERSIEWRNLIGPMIISFCHYKGEDWLLRKEKLDFFEPAYFVRFPPQYAIGGAAFMLSTVVADLLPRHDIDRPIGYDCFQASHRLGLDLTDGRRCGWHVVADALVVSSTP